MKIGQLKYLFVVMIAGMLISCSSDAGAEAQQETSDLHYDSPKDFWLSNPSCNEYTNGVKAYVQETKPYTCVRRNNEWMWTKICESNGRTYIDGESWNDGGKCVQQFYKCADGLIVYNGSSGLNPSCGINWSSNAVSSSSIYSSSVGYAGSYGTLIDSRDGQTYKTVTIGTQIWMAENLNYQDSRFSKDTGDVHLLAKHRYTWGEAIDSAGLFSGTQIHCKINSCSYSEGPYKENRCLIPDRVRGVCPEGWHLPTRVEWYEMLFVTTGVKFDDDGKYKTLSYEKTKVLRSTSGWELCPDKSRCDVVDGVVVSTYSSPVTGLPNEVVFRYGELQNKNGTDLYGLSIYPDYYSITWRENRYVATFWIPESYFVSCSGDIDDYQISIIIKGRDHDATLGDYEGLFVRAFSHRGSVRCVKDDASGLFAKSSSSVALPASSSVKITAPFENTVGSVTDSRDGQTYKTVKIGSQTWMAQNLNYKSENSYCFDDKASKCSKYGRLYTWASAMDSSGVWSTNGKDCGYGKTCIPKYPVQGVCPKGWHVPAIEEWETLLTVVGGLSTAGIVLKSISGWIDFTDNGTDAFSFSALPAGERDYSGNYGGEGLNASFWSSTEPESTGDEINFAYFIGLFNDDDGALLSGYRKYSGVSVRCLKDDASGQLANSSSSLKKYSSSSTVKSSSSVKITSSSNVAKSSSSAALPASSSVKVSVPVENTVGSMTDSRDGQTYKTVKIGTQTWMAENLNYAYLQPTIVLDSTSFCYNNSASYCKKYGRLYTWAAAMDSVGMFSANSKGCGYGSYCSLIYPVRGVCPEGWHLPTQTEWYTLFTAIDDRAITGITLTIAGSKLKSVSGWSDNGNGTDVFSFSALPAGYRRYDDEKYYDAGNGAYFWSSSNELLYTLVGGDCKLSNGEDCKLAYYMYLLYKDDYAALNVRDKFHAYSVRCVKD